jgi:hypothetical protein
MKKSAIYFISVLLLACLTTASLSAQEARYMVEHYKETVDGTFPDRATKTEVFTGVAGELTKANPLETDGFITKDFSQTAIASDNSTVIKIYYERKMVTVSISSRSGVFENNENALTAKGKFGTPLEAPPTPVIKNVGGQVFSYWIDQDNNIIKTMPDTFPDHDTIYYASYERTQCIISFIGNGGSTADGQSTYTQTVFWDDTNYWPEDDWSESDYLTSNRFSRNGYHFKGWATTANGRAEYKDNNKFHTTHKVVLFAVWERN